MDTKIMKQTDTYHFSFLDHAIVKLFMIDIHFFIQLAIGHMITKCMCQILLVLYDLIHVLHTRQVHWQCNIALNGTQFCESNHQKPIHKAM